MHQHRLGKRECHADKTGQTLTQGVIPPLDMGGFSRLFVHSEVLFLGNHRRVGRTHILEEVPLPIFLWNGLPQPLARLFASIPNHLRHHLPRLAAEDNPNP